MEVVVKEKEKWVRELEISVPWKEVNGKLEEAYQNLKKSVVIPGFRRGRAPLSLLKVRFRKVVEEEVKQNLMEEYFQKGVEKENRRPVSTPSLEELEFGEEKPFRFKAEVEVITPVELGDYKDIEVERERIEVTEDDVEAVIQAKREELSEYRSVDRPCTMGDRVIVDVTIEEEGKVLQTAKDLQVVLGEGALPEEVEKGMGGMKKGEEKKIFVEEEGLTYRVKLKDVKEKRLIALDEEFLRSLGGVKSMEELREEVRKELEELAKLKEERDLENAILEKLIKISKIEVPPSLVERLAKYYRLGLEGKESEEARKEALERIKIELILDEIARKEKIEVTDKELEEVRKKILEKGTPEEKRMWLPEENKERLRRRLLTDKILKFLKGKVKIKEKKKLILTPEEAKRMTQVRSPWKKKGELIVPGG